MEFVKALTLILIAEMGDKTQIVAMAFATKYKLHQILIGVALGSGLNHGLAILFGAMLTQYVDLSFVSAAAGMLFLLFAFLSLQVEEPEEDSGDGKEHFGPLLTVAFAFFLGELGDKTQLTALSLSTDAQNPTLILLGTTSGMVLTSLLGILIAQKFGERIPEEIMKMLASLVFLIFGIQKLWMTSIDFKIPFPVVSVVFLSIMLLMLLRARYFHKSVRQLRDTKLKHQSAALYRTVKLVKSGLESMCLGEGKCGQCKGNACLIGYMKLMTDLMEKEETIPEGMYKTMSSLIHKDVPKPALLKALNALLEYYDEHPQEFLKNMPLNEMLKALERLMFTSKPKDIKKYDEYKRWIDEHIRELE